MKRYTIILLVLCLFSQVSLARDGFRVVFYNVENFFDCNHDSLKNDYEFLPGGIRGWTPTRFWKKAGNIAKVVAAVGGDRFPEIIGLAEVENVNCIQSLLRGSPLKNAQYSFVHVESPDARGVDVCLLYNRYLFEVQNHEALTIVFKNEPFKNTRDILYVSGKAYPNKLLHLFVCHFPSRLGGALESETYRREVATRIRQKTDSLFRLYPDPNILIMGDFNDYPSDRSLTMDLKAENPVVNPDSGKIYNLMLPLDGNPEKGSNKHQADWGILDQIMVSGNLLKQSMGASIFDPDFLLLEDQRWLGRKPFRTYHGMVYQGGFSDHLPVYADFEF